MQNADPNWDIILKYFPDLTKHQQSQFERLYAIYYDWNVQINVISRKDTHLFYQRHVLHSLSIAKLLPLTEETMVLDVGTGGGFPGIPLSIMYPDCTFHLVDSIGKKIKVVNDVAEQLNLANVKGEQVRVEALKLRYDLIVTRAVAPLKTLKHWTSKKLIKKSSKKISGLVCLKGGDLGEEIAEAKAKAKIFNLADHFKDEFFETKKLVWVKSF